MNLKSVFIHFFKRYTFLLPVVFSCLVYFAWFGQGIFTNADWRYIFPNKSQEGLLLYSWFADTSFGAQSYLLWQYPFNLLRKAISLIGFVPERVDQFTVFLPIIFGLPLAGYLLNRELNFKKSAAVLGAFIVAFNTYFLAISTQGHLLINLSCIFLLFSTVTFLKWIRTNRWFYGIASLLLLLTTSSIDFRIAYLGILLLGLVTVFKSVFQKSAFSILGKVLLLIFLFGILNLYWLLPSIFAKNLSNNAALSRGLFGDAYWGIQSSINLFHPFWSEGKIVWFSIQKMALWRWLLPIVAFSSLLTKKKKATILLFSVIALLGILLTKQADIPFKNLYAWLYSHIPGFNAFREATKFYIFTLIGYSALFAGAFEFVSSRKLFSKNLFTKTILAIGFSSLLAINAFPIINGSLGSIYRAQFVPREYLSVSEFLMSHSQGSKVLWFPTNSRWSPFSSEFPRLSMSNLIEDAWRNFSSAKKDQIPSKEEIVDFIHKPYVNQLFDVSGIRYVVVPRDLTGKGDEFYQYYGLGQVENIDTWYANKLNEVGFLKKATNTDSGLNIYENVGAFSNVFSFKKLYSLDVDQDPFSIGNFSEASLRKAYFFAENDPRKKYNSNITSLAPLFSFNEKKNGSALASINEKMSKNASSSLYVKRNQSAISLKVDRNILSLIASQPALFKLNGEQVDLPRSQPLDFSSGYLGSYGRSFYEHGGLLFSLKKYLGQKFPLNEKVSGNVSVLEGKSQLIVNGSFELGSWQEKVGNCNRFDDNPIISMSLDQKDKTDGRQSLQLDATRHTACVSTEVLLPNAQGEYVLSFDYQSPNGRNAAFYLQFDDAKKTVIRDSIHISTTTWQTYTKKIAVPLEAKKAKLYLYGYSSDEKTNITTRYDDVYFGQLTTIKEFVSNIEQEYIPQKVALNEQGNIFEYYDPTYRYINEFKNPSFEDGSWQASVSDCNKYDDHPQIFMSRNEDLKTDGDFSLQLEAIRHTACVSTVVPVKSGSLYELSFDYQSPNKSAASYYLAFNDPDKNSISDRIEIKSDDWQSYSKTVSVPTGANTMSVYLYARESDRSTKNINRYDNFKLIEVPDLRDAFYLVSEPTSTLVEPKSISFDLVNPTKKQVHIKGATTSFFLGMSESYHDQWQLQVRNKKIQGRLNGWWPFAKPDRVGDEYHYKLDGFLNAWYVDTDELCVKQAKCTQNPDGSYDIEMTIEFWPQRWFYLGLLISGTTFAGCIGYLVFDGVRILRRKRKAKQTTV